MNVNIAHWLVRINDIVEHLLADFWPFIELEKRVLNSLKQLGGDERCDKLHLTSRNVLRGRETREGSFSATVPVLDRHHRANRQIVFDEALVFDAPDRCLHYSWREWLLLRLILLRSLICHH